MFLLLIPDIFPVETGSRLLLLFLVAFTDRKGDVDDGDRIGCRWELLSALNEDDEDDEAAGVEV